MDESDPESVTARRIALLRREQDRSKWLNSPNAYQKVEVLETGTDNPKVITKVCPLDSESEFPSVYENYNLVGSEVEIE